MYVINLNKEERILLNKVKNKLLETTNIKKGITDGNAIKIALIKFLK